MKRFSKILENKKFEGRGSLFELIKASVDYFFAVEGDESSNEFFNEHLPEKLGILEDIHHEYYDELNDRDQGKLGHYYRNWDSSYSEFRELIFKKYKFNIDEMDNIYLDNWVLYEQMRQIKKSNLNFIRKLNED
jgi:hypothetical protein